MTPTTPRPKPELRSARLQSFDNAHDRDRPLLPHRINPRRSVFGVGDFSRPLLPPQLHSITCDPQKFAAPQDLQLSYAQQHIYLSVFFASSVVKSLFIYYITLQMAHFDSLAFSRPPPKLSLWFSA